MADKKLNEVTKVTDMAYVPVIMVDGSIGQIAKADLASVVAGQMKFINFEATCIHVLSTVYVQVIHTNFKNSVFGKYILKTPEGMLSEVLFSSKVDLNGYFSLGFDNGLPMGSTLLVMYGG